MEPATTLLERPVRLGNLTQALRHSPDFEAVHRALASRSSVVIDGAVGSSCAVAIAALGTGLRHPLVVICPQGATCEDLEDDLKLFTDLPVTLFPAWENGPRGRLVYDDIYAERLRTLKRLLDAREPWLLLTSIQSLLQPVPPPDAVRASTRRLEAGLRLSADELVRWLARHGFHATSGVELPGEFARRGGILDVFGPDWVRPVRLEWFDDEIESLREFDVSSQRSLQPIPAIDLTILPSAGDHEMRAARMPGHLIDYLHDESCCVFIEPEQSLLEAEKFVHRQSEGTILHDRGETLRRLQERGHVSLSLLAAGTADLQVRLGTQTVERFSGDLGRVRQELEEIARAEDVFLICQTGAEIQRLQEVFADSHLHAAGRLHFVTGRLSSGFHWPQQQTLLLGGTELFRRSELRRSVRALAGKKIDSFLDLRPGDLVVHLVHGIGRYRGMENLQRDQQVEDHLVIEFRGGTKVYVPATKIDLVQKYVGASKARPQLATVGGQQWSKRRRAAEAAVTDMAAELLELQAQRAARPGLACLPDSQWQREFDASFPYEETDDQLAAVAAIKNDMCLATPMDRLLCGDVGFGKTEVAMRAAFKAVDNGYQVAILVPTTILAEQHYRSFQQRMAEFPFTISRLSRFCLASEEREIVQGLSQGSVDIVIGTHRLASHDVQFHNLGLLIIDEEQRFGVQVKERLKSLRTTVDVLTMSATPIPRTLHMALTGMRDISNLQSPPQDRVAVETRVTRWNDELIRDAMLRELNRGGQVYFVHNRVKDIHLVHRQLREIVPEASIRVGHGQMLEHELEAVMVDFVAGRFDVLLATTIVESGLDIPNANTIFINEADHYGLSDLHQLRGRVGRYKHRAYCYLLLPSQKHITPDAAKRLRAIEEFSEMGAGFAIAMRDLEFRGAGNILGTQQSGHIAAIGYELYCDLLEAAVRRLKRLPPRLKIEVQIELPGHAFLPDDYVSQLRVKIDLYRRLARITLPQELADFRAELVDRFGPPPGPVLQLLAWTELKLDAAFWQVQSVKLETQDGQTYLVLEAQDDARLRQLARQNGKQLRIVDRRFGYLPLAKDSRDAAAIWDRAKSVLRPQ